MRFLLPAVLIALSACALAAEPADLRTRKTGDDWPKFLGPNGNSVSSEKGIIVNWPVNGLKIVWQTRLALGYSPPTVSRGRIFLFDASPDANKKTNHSRLSCRESETGKELWKFEYDSDYDDYFGYDNGPRCSPIVDGDRVYLHGAEGMLHCLNVEKGDVLWKVNTHLEYLVLQNFFGVGSCPLVYDNLVIVPIGGSPKGTPAGVDDFLRRKGNGTCLVAFDKFTGKEKYRVGEELASYSSPVIATINGKSLGLYLARGGLIGFDPKTGKQEFHRPWRARMLESVNAANPVVVDDKVLLSECYGIGSSLLKIKGNELEEVWGDADKGRDASLRCHWNTPIYHEGYVYACSGRHTNEAELRCVEFATGKVMWRQRGLTRSSLLMVDGHFVCQCEDGNLILLKINPKRYEEVSRWDLGEARLLDYPAWGAPVLSHGLMYLRGKERLLCVELIPEKK
jgi:outer membrane protein assembly factor BamB